MGHCGLPLRLEFGKGFFAQVPSIAPALGKLVQEAGKALPVIVQRRAVGLGPGFELFEQGQAQLAVGLGLGFEFVQPGLDHFVGLVAGLVKALPHRVVGHAALVGLLPFLAHGTQGFLQFTPAQGLALWTLEQAFGFDDQGLAQLVGAPSLPAFELAGRAQGQLRLVLQLGVDQLAIFFEG